MSAARLHIIGYWSEDRQANGFRIRAPHDENQDRYNSLYGWLNGGKCSAFSVMDDFPWDYIAFSDPWDEQAFLVLYQDDITFDSGEEAYRPLPKIANKLGVVPVEERIEGQSYLENCGHHHVWRAPTGRTLEDEIADILIAEIAKEIDDEALRTLLEEHALRKTDQ